jgi:cytoskeletal protein CcmA (bactofilin family)
MKTIHKFLSVLTLLALLTLTLATPALAFDGRGGDNVVIEADEVVEDDLYVGAETFVLEGTVEGDLVVFAQTITINGTVNGDLMAAGQSVVINGTVTDDVRIAGAGLLLGETANIGGDVISAGASLETKSGSSVGHDVVFAGGQSLLAGDVSDDVLAGTPALELRGAFGGDVQAWVDANEETKSSPPMQMYMQEMPIAIPSVQPGLTIAEDASIEGNLEYTSTIDLAIPSGVVAGEVIRTTPQVDQRPEKAEPTPAQRALDWTLGLLRSVITLVLFGLLLAWLLPTFMRNVMGKLEDKPAASLGWGVVAFCAFFFAIFFIIVVMIIGGVVFGLLTLDGISSTIIWVGLLAIFELIVGFILVTAFLTKILVGWLGGKLILGRFNPTLAQHKVWPLLLGMFLVALAIALPFAGPLFGLIVMFLGLGALWIWARDLWQTRKTAS